MCIGNNYDDDDTRTYIIYDEIGTISNAPLTQSPPHAGRASPVISEVNSILKTFFLLFFPVFCRSTDRKRAGTHTPADLR